MSFLDRVRRRSSNIIGAGYRRESKRYLTLAVGCTGGKHRSVVMSEELAAAAARGRASARPSSIETSAVSDAPTAVALGGGHGLHASLSALRLLTSDLTAIVTVADDGGSSGRIRHELNVLPPGDLRMALAALAGDDAGASATGRTCSSIASADPACSRDIRSATSCSPGCSTATVPTRSTRWRGWVRCSAPWGACCR